MAKYVPPVAAPAPGLPTATPSKPTLKPLPSLVKATPAVTPVAPAAAEPKPLATSGKLIKPGETKAEPYEKQSRWNLISPMEWTSKMTDVAISFAASIPHIITGLRQGFSVSTSGVPIVNPDQGRFARETGASLLRTAKGETLQEAWEMMKAGQAPVLPLVETAGNVAIVAGGAGAIAGRAAAPLSASGAAAGRGATFVSGAEAGSAVSTAQATAAAGLRGATAEGLAKSAAKLKTVERVANKVGAAPIAVPIKIADNAFKVVGWGGRQWADYYRNMAKPYLDADPLSPEGRRYLKIADDANRRFGKPIYTGGATGAAKRQVEVLNQRKLDTYSKRAQRKADANQAEVNRAYANLVDNPEFVDAINPETGQPQGPLTALENQAIVASLNGRARLLNRLSPMLKMSPGDLAYLGRIDFNEGYSLTPEGAQLAVDFLNGTLPEWQQQRLSVAAEKLSQELEKTTQKAREGYGRSKPLDPAYDMPFPLVDRFMAKLKEQNAVELYAEMLELQRNGFFDDVTSQEVSDYMRGAVNRAPRAVALDPMVYPAKERYNLAFYNRLRDAFESEAQYTAGGSPPPPGTTPGRPGPSLPTTGLPAEPSYTQVKSPGMLSRTPRRFLVNSVKILDNLKGRARMLGEQLADLELRIGTAERSVVRKRLEYETLTGYYEDANGFRVVVEPGDPIPPGVVRKPGQIELLTEHRDGLKQVFDDMVAKQSDAITVDGVVYDQADVADALANADELVAQAESIAQTTADEAGQIIEEINTLEGEKADAANALDDAGVDPEALIDAAAEDAINLPEDPLDETMPQGRDMERARLENGLRQLEVAEKAAAEDMQAARMEVLDAQAAMQEAIAKEKEAVKAVAKAESKPPAKTAEVKEPKTSKASDLSKRIGKAVKEAGKAQEKWRKANQQATTGKQGGNKPMEEAGKAQRTEANTAKKVAAQNVAKAIDETIATVVEEQAGTEAKGAFDARTKPVDPALGPYTADDLDYLNGKVEENKASVERLLVELKSELESLSRYQGALETDAARYPGAKQTSFAKKTSASITIIQQKIDKILSDLFVDSYGVGLYSAEIEKLAAPEPKLKPPVKPTALDITDESQFPKYDRGSDAGPREQAAAFISRIEEGIKFYENKGRETPLDIATQEPLSASSAQASANRYEEIIKDALEELQLDLEMYWDYKRLYEAKAPNVEEWWITRKAETIVEGIEEIKTFAEQLGRFKRDAGSGPQLVAPTAQRPAMMVYGPDELFADIDAAISAGKSSTAELSRTKKAFETEYVPPAKDKVATKNFDKIIASADDGGLRSSGKKAMVPLIDGELWYTNAYFLSLLDPESVLAKKLAEMGETEGGIYTSPAKEAGDVKKAPIERYHLDAPNVSSIVKTAVKATAKSPAAQILGVDTLHPSGPSVIFRDPDGLIVTVSKEWVDAVNKPGSTFHLSAFDKPAVVRDASGKPTALIMPVKNVGSVPTRAEIVKSAVSKLKDRSLGKQIQEKIDQAGAGTLAAPPATAQLAPVAVPEAVSVPRELADAVAKAEQDYIDAQDYYTQKETEFREAQGARVGQEKQIKAFDEGPTEPVKIEPIKTGEAQVIDPVVDVAAIESWVDHGNNNYTINTGTRKYVATKKEVGQTKTGKTKARWVSQRIASDGLPVQSTTMEFPSFKALRDYVKETTVVDAQVALQTPKFRPGRELPEAKGLLTPPELLKAEKRLSSVEGRAVSLTRNIDNTEGRLLRMREIEATKRAELVETTQAAVGLEARLGREIITQPDVTTVDGRPTGRLFVAPEQGAPSVVRPIGPDQVPVGGTGPGRTQLRPMSQYVREAADSAADAASGNVDLVDRSLAEANLRRAEMLTQEIPLETAMTTPRDIGQQFEGSQYVPGGQEGIPMIGPKGMQTRGFTGDITVSSEKLRGANEGIYDIIEIGRRVALEQRQLTLNEGFKLVLASNFAITPLQLLGQQAIDDIRAKALDRATYAPFGPDAVVGGVAAYAEGLLNRDKRFRDAFNTEFGRLLNDEMLKNGWETLNTKGDINKKIGVDTVLPDTRYLPTYAVERISSRWIPYTTATGNRAIDAYLKANSKVTGLFKNLTLPLSVSWQLGDILSNFMVANIFGVNPGAMARGMTESVAQNFGDLRGAARYVGTGEMPVLGPKAELIAPYVQDIGMRIEESIRSKGLTAPDRKPLLSTVPVVKYPANFLRRARDTMYRFNETTNRIQRHAFMLETLQQNLDGLGKTVDDIADHGIDAMPENVQQAFYDAADTANEVLGDFMDLSQAERRWALTHMPFYSWIKHVHKLFLKIAREHPSAILWHAYIGNIAYDPETDPFGLVGGMFGVPGGYASGNIMSPLLDVMQGPVAEAVQKNEFRRAGAAFNPLVRTAVAGLTGFNIGAGREITRPSGTAQLSRAGFPQATPLVGRPKELLGFAAQQFPLISKLADIAPSVGTLPGTTLQLGPVKRYDTGAARPGQFGVGTQEKYGGRLLALPRLFTIPGVPSMGEKDVQRQETTARRQLVQVEKNRLKAQLKQG